MVYDVFNCMIHWNFTPSKIPATIPDKFADDDA